MDGWMLDFDYAQRRPMNRRQKLSSDILDSLHMRVREIIDPSSKPTCMCTSLTTYLPTDLLPSRHGREERHLKRKMGVDIRNPSEV